MRSKVECSAALYKQMSERVRVQAWLMGIRDEPEELLHKILLAQVEQGEITPEFIRRRIVDQMRIKLGRKGKLIRFETKERKFWRKLTYTIDPTLRLYRKQILSRLTRKDRRIVSMLLKGYTQLEISREYNVTEMAVSHWRRHIEQRIAKLTRS